MQAGHNTMSIKKQHIQRNQCIFHPETHMLGLVINEQHASVGRHGFAEHQSTRPFQLIIGDFDVEPDPAPGTAQLDHIRATFGRDRGDRGQNKHCCGETATLDLL